MAEIHEFFNAMHAGDEVRARQLLALTKLDPNAVEPGKQLSWRERLGGRSAEDDGLPSMAGFNALHVAIRHGHVNLARDLIDRGADVNRRTKGLTPIHLARSAASIALLSERGADLNAKTSERPGVGQLASGSTALHQAAMHGFGQEFIKELLDRGADPNIANKDGLVPLHLAASRHVPTYHQLIASGARDDAGADDKPLPSTIYQRTIAELQVAQPEAVGEPAPKQTAAPAAGQPAPEQPATPAAGQPAPEQAAAPAAGQPAPEQAAAPAAGQPAPEQAAAPAAGQPAPEQAAAPAAGQPASEQSEADEEKEAEKVNEIEVGESDEVGQPGAAVDSLGDDVGGGQVKKPVLTKSGFVLPKVIKDLYVEVDGRYVDRRTEQVSFEDEGKKLTTESNDRKVIEHMIAVAHAKGWSSITATGSDEFRRETWIAAQVMGLTVKGYEPTKEDVAAAIARKEEMRIDAGKVAPTRERNEKGGEIRHEASAERQRATQPGQGTAPAQPAPDPQSRDAEPAQQSPQQPAPQQASAPEAEQSAGPNDDVPAWTQDEWDRIRYNMASELREDRANREAQDLDFERERLSKSPIARENLAREVLARAGLDPKQLLAADGAVKDEGRMTAEKFEALVAERSAQARPQVPDASPAAPSVAPTAGQPVADQPATPTPAGQPMPEQKATLQEASAAKESPLDPNAPATGNDAREAALRVALEAEMEEMGVPAAQRDELRGQLAHNIGEVHQNGIALDVAEPLTMNAMPSIEHQPTPEPNMGKDTGHEILR